AAGLYRTLRARPGPPRPRYAGSAVGSHPRRQRDRRHRRSHRPRPAERHHLMAEPAAAKCLGAHASGDGVRFAVWSSAATAMWVSIFDESREEEVARIPLEPAAGGVHSTFVPGLKPGARYGFRA